MLKQTNKFRAKQNASANRQAMSAHHLGRVVFITSILALTACSGGRYGDLESFFDDVRSQPKGRITPLPEVMPYKTFTYNAKELRDPFVPHIEELVSYINTGLRPDMNRKREPLEQYSLDTLDFVGHLEKSGIRWGLVSAPDKSVHRVQIGNFVGKNYGKIISITETSIKLVEIIPSGSGSWVDREASLALNE